MNAQQNTYIVGTPPKTCDTDVRTLCLNVYLYRPTATCRDDHIKWASIVSNRM